MQANTSFSEEIIDSELVINDNDNILVVPLEYSMRFGRKPSAAFIK
jgi:hypothetical protein